MISPEELKRIHKMSFNNAETLKKSDAAVCFYCKRYLTKQDMLDIEYIESKYDHTGFCPFCGIDSLIASIDMHPHDVPVDAMFNNFFTRKNK
jgi:hypothetical protein